MAAAVALSPAGCVTLTDPAATTTRYLVGEPSELVAALCARIVRLAFPDADGRPYAAGALLFDRGDGHYEIEVVDGDRGLGCAGNVRLALVTADPSLAGAVTLRVVRHPTEHAHTAAAVRGSLGVSILRQTKGTVIVVRRRGSLRASAVPAHIAATLALAEAIDLCHRSLSAGDLEIAAAGIRTAIGAAQRDDHLPDSLWLAQAHLAEAVVHLARRAEPEARQALAQTVALSPDSLGARRALAVLTRNQAQPDSATEHDRTLAVMPGLGFVAWSSSMRETQSQRLRGDDPQAWLAAAQTRLQAGDLEGARRHAERARDHRAYAARALAMLSTLAEENADDRLAAELRLCQALNEGFTPELVLALSRSLDRQGEPERALRWLGDSWSDLDGVRGARELLCDLVTRVGHSNATRVLASSHLAGLAGAAMPSSRGRLVLARIDRALHQERPTSASIGTAVEPAAMPSR